MTHSESLFLYRAQAPGRNTSEAIEDISAVCRYAIERCDGFLAKVRTAPDPKNGVDTTDLGDSLRGGACGAFTAACLNDNAMTPDVRRASLRHLAQPLDRSGVSPARVDRIPISHHEEDRP